LVVLAQKPFEVVRVEAEKAGGSDEFSNGENDAENSEDDLKFES
jgi:hypothetical protein